MQYTENYSMNKPQFGENALVTKLNENADTLDTLIYNTRQMQADSYDSTQTYNTGDLVSYNSALYRCLADNVTGTWDATKWAATNLAEEVMNVGGGESALADLEDVEITNPSTGQALLFDDSDDKWKNQNLLDVSVTKTATGNPIELTDAANAPMVKCVTQITGSQDLHGQSAPWVGGSGKNKLPMVLADIKAKNTGGTWNGNIYTWNGVTFEILMDSAENVTGIKATGTASANAPLIVCNNPDFTEGTSYIMNGCPANGSDSTYKIQYSNNVDFAFNDRGSGVEFTEFSHTVLNRTIRVAIYSGYAIPSGGLVFYPMIRLSTESDPTFAPYSNICPIMAYTEGEIEVSDGDGNTTTHTTTYPSAIYRGSEDVVNGEVVTEWGMIASYAGETLPGEWISDRDEYAPGTTPTTGAQVAYALATPITSPVTPTNLPIKSLSGYNHIESSTGEMEVEYITENYQPLVDLIQSGNEHTYSTSEQVVGKWTDGRPIYERTFVVPNFTANVSDAGFYDGVLDLSTEFADVERSWGCIDSSYIKLQDTTTRIVNFVDTQNPKQPTVQFLGAARTGTLTLTMQYLKSTVRTRSLNTPLTSQKAQIEPLTDKTEEVPTEDEKAVNEEENTNETR